MPCLVTKPSEEPSPWHSLTSQRMTMQLIQEGLRRGEITFAMYNGSAFVGTPSVPHPLRPDRTNISRVITQASTDSLNSNVSLERMQISHLVGSDEQGDNSHTLIHPQGGSLWSQQSLSSQDSDESYLAAPSRRANTIDHLPPKNHMDVCASRHPAPAFKPRRPRQACDHCRRVRKKCVAHPSGPGCLRCYQFAQTCDLTIKTDSAIQPILQPRIVAVKGRRGNLVGHVIRPVPICRCPLTIGPRDAG